MVTHVYDARPEQKSYALSRKSCPQGATIPKSIREETMRSGRQLVQRTKMEGGPDSSAVFSFGRIARHPVVNPGRGDKHGDELGDATGSLVLIVRLLLVRVIPLRLHPFAAVAAASVVFGLSFCRRSSFVLLVLLHCCLFVTHLSLLPAATWLFSHSPFFLSLSRIADGAFPYLIRSLTTYSLVPGLRRHYRWRALNVFCLFLLPFLLVHLLFFILLLVVLACLPAVTAPTEPSLSFYPSPTF